MSASADATGFVAIDVPPRELPTSRLTETCAQCEAPSDKGSSVNIALEHPLNASYHPLWHQSMDPSTIAIARAELTDERSRILIQALNAELRGAYSEAGATHFALDAEEVAPGRGVFLLVSVDRTPVGCGALRLLDAGTAELKRMYVAPAARGKGLGRRLVAALEAEARALGLGRLVLETGIRQTAALALYRATGFHEIPLFGEYCLSPETSVCLGKELARA